MNEPIDQNHRDSLRPVASPNTQNAVAELNKKYAVCMNRLDFVLLINYQSRLKDSIYYIDF